ncbi:MAG: hypothetical protein H6Q65_1293 [Firmicutes bacterium]|nr:hypothetical protein [Bacillota bacterium]
MNAGSNNLSYDCCMGDIHILLDPYAGIVKSTVVSSRRLFLILQGFLKFLANL